VKTLPISFYAFQLSASAWFRKKFCGKINIVFKIKVVAVVTIAINGWLCEVANCGTAYFLLLKLYKASDKHQFTALLAILQNHRYWQLFYLFQHSPHQFTSY
jgi:hypothetical protein